MSGHPDRFPVNKGKLREYMPEDQRKRADVAATGDDERVGAVEHTCVAAANAKAWIHAILEPSRSIHITVDVA